MNANKDNLIVRPDEWGVNAGSSKEAILSLSGPLLAVEIVQPRESPSIRQEYSTIYDVQCRGVVVEILSSP